MANIDLFTDWVRVGLYFIGGVLLILNATSTYGLTRVHRGTVGLLFIGLSFGLYAALYFNQTNLHSIFNDFVLTPLLAFVTIIEVLMWISNRQNQKVFHRRKDDV